MFQWIRALANFSQSAVSTQSAEHLVQLAVERSLPAVRGRLNLDCRSMCPAELRGYVRARAWGVVRAQAQRLTAERGLSAGSAETLASRALERTTHTILRKPPQQAVMPLPAPHVQLRIAG